MPVVGVGRDLLFKALGQTYSDEEFQDLCFEYGIELDDVTTEQKMLRKERNQELQDSQTAEEEVIYRIDIPANRYDMMCIEGIARAINVFKGRQKLIQYRLTDMRGRQIQQMVVKPETMLVRPFILCAILRGVTLDKHRYDSFIDLQDKLHQNLCRQRSLVSVGTHDLSTIRVDTAKQGPFSYEALPPEDINFVPLKQSRSFNAAELLDYYLKNDLKLKRFVPIIHKSLVYPVVLDANRTVLSLPPIINGAHSQITLDTTDIFMEVTATDLAKANIVLATLCTMFSEYCAAPFEVEPVEIVDSLGRKTVCPSLEPQRRTVQVSYINSCLGLDLSAQQVAGLLGKMALDATPVEAEGAVDVLIPRTRSDILHDADIMEDVAIAYGYNNMKQEVPSISTFGRELPIMQLTEAIRAEIKDYTETLTWALCSRAENFDFLLRKDSSNMAVSIGNPATAEFEVCRTTLLPALLRTLASNKDAPLPLKLFEVSDVILLDSKHVTGCRNERHLAVVHCSRETEFEVVHGLLNRIMEVLGVPLSGPLSTETSRGKAAKSGWGYKWHESESPTFFPGRHASIFAQDTYVGEFGILHPEVLSNFDIPHPVTALELNLEPFCFDQLYKPFPPS